ncbi:MAG: crotonase/enoyl-CoA hydratase family protein [Pseudomonadota bacterium]
METVEIDVDPRGVAMVILNRPGVHNALDERMITELTMAARRLADDARVRAVILTGKGKSFCAGGDLGWMKAQIAATSEQRHAQALALARMLYDWNTLPKPVIGRIQGPAFGGGIGLMSVCDVAVCVDTAKFGLTETRLGLIPATIGPYVLARMGEARARRVFMSARRFDAEEARRLELVASIVPSAGLEAAVEAEVVPYLGCAPGAVAAAKALARRLGPPITEATMGMSVEALIAQWEGGEASEGITAFFERRPPRWAV